MRAMAHDVEIVGAGDHDYDQGWHWAISWVITWHFATKTARQEIYYKDMNEFFRRRT